MIIENWSNEPYKTHGLDCHSAYTSETIGGVEFNVAITLYNAKNGDESAIAFCYYDEDDNYREYLLDCGKMGLIELKIIAERHAKAIESSDFEELEDLNYVLIM